MSFCLSAKTYVESATNLRLSTITSQGTERCSISKTDSVAPGDFSNEFQRSTHGGSVQTTNAQISAGNSKHTTKYMQRTFNKNSSVCQDEISPKGWPLSNIRGTQENGLVGNLTWFRALHKRAPVAQKRCLEPSWLSLSRSARTAPGVPNTFFVHGIRRQSQI